jgi:hypothetical protein
MPADGIAHEWITSFDEAKILILTSVGKAIAPVACSRIKLLIPFFRGRWPSRRANTGSEAARCRVGRVVGSAASATKWFVVYERRAAVNKFAAIPPIFAGKAGKDRRVFS